MSPNDHPNPSHRRQKEFENSHTFKDLQVPLNSLNNKKFRGFRGLRLHGPSGQDVGPDGCLSTRIVTK